MFNPAPLLSIFPGADLLGKAFTKAGFCVVAGPDKILGGDIREFKVPPDFFEAVIGGSPCQDFSLLNRNPGEYGYEMQNEYVRVVKEARPKWFLYENVSAAPEFEIEGYTTQVFNLDLAWFTGYSRLRKFIFGSRNGDLLNPMGKPSNCKPTKGGAVTTKDNRTIDEIKHIMGLPPEFNFSDLSLTTQKKVIGNGVPLQLGYYLAQLIKRDYYKQSIGMSFYRPPSSGKVCDCGCGRHVIGQKTKRYHSAACRKKVSRRKLKTDQGGS